MAVQIKHPVPSDLDIAQSAKLRPILDVAKDVGLLESELDFYGPYKAKVHLSALQRLEKQTAGKYIDVTAMTPTPLGEGKTTTTVGLAQALGFIKKQRVFTCIRQPSMGPTFGVKGGAAGGGYAQVVPMEDFNLHLTGDIHAISAAHNLLAAQIDARMFHERVIQDDDKLAAALCPKGDFAPSIAKRARKLGIRGTQLSQLNSDEKRRLFRLDIDPQSITWQRVVDISDRMLRRIKIGLGKEESGSERLTGYDITVASEIMAILGLASSLPDMRERFSKMVIGTNHQGEPITAEDLGVAGAVCVLMKDALMPNLMQTLEGTPAFVHAGPFANIAHGNSSIIADKIALKLADYVVTESGFGADIGMEKFVNIKCRTSGLKPDAIVIVATVRGLKMHGGGPRVVPGRPLDATYTSENLALLEAGMPNLERHISHAKSTGVPVIVAINSFKYDTKSEINLLKKLTEQCGAPAVESTHWMNGGAGSEQLAEAIMEVTQQRSEFRFLYPLEMSIKDKIKKVATDVYHADGVSFSPEAEERIRQYEAMGYGKFPVCMAKTHLSFSAEPSLKGAPKGFTIPIRDLRASVGAGFIVAYVGEVRTMPGLPSRPAFYDVDLDLETGRVQGLF